MARCILVALDETEASRRAAAFVNRFFDGVDAEIIALNVAHVPIPWYPATGWGYGIAAPYAYPLPEHTDEDVEAAEERGEQVVAESGIHPDEAVVDFGDPVEVIRSTAGERDADLVVVGTSSKGWWSRLLEGSVSERLLRDAECPVLVVR